MSQSIEQRGNIGIIWVAYPPVNAIGQGVRAHIIAGLAALTATDGVQAIVLACRGRTFMAGADITEFGKPAVAPSIGDVAAALEAASRPVVAAIFGTALGGGLELALACHYRVAHRTAKLGLPEVKLGILPGCGGTQRLPRLTGLDFAMTAIVSGAPFSADVALENKVVDLVTDADVTDAAIIFAGEIVKNKAPLRRVSDMSVEMAAVPADYFAAARARLAREQRNLFAPQRIVDCLEAAQLPFAQGMAKERDMIMACFANTQSKALRHVFFAERQAAKIPGLPEMKPEPVLSAAVIGAGTMGGGIAMNFANAGIPVTVLELNAEALARGLAVVRGNYEAAAQKGRMSSADVEARLALIKTTTNYDDLANADLIIEAVFETMEVKRTVFAALDRVAKPGAMLASNTSYLSIDEIAAATSRPDHVLGLHFFSPANVMRLCEIVRGEKTAPDVLARAIALIKRIGKLGIVCGNGDGFIGNRMLSGYGREAALLNLEGADMAQIDRALHGFGMAMGPFAVGDLAGLDVGYKNRRNRDSATLDPRVGFVPDKLVELGRFGQKTKAGYYDYEEGSRTPKPSAVTAALVDEARTHFHIRPREIADTEIVERCLLALVNIGADLMQQGLAYRASDIDLVYLNGYGFPAYRGGPMFWAEHEMGFAAAIEKMRSHGWTPNPWLVEKA